MIFPATAGDERFCAAATRTQQLKGHIVWGIKVQFNSILTTMWITCTKRPNYDYKSLFFPHKTCWSAVAVAFIFSAPAHKHQRSDNAGWTSHLAGVSQACSGCNANRMYSSSSCLISKHKGSTQWALKAWADHTHPWLVHHSLRSVRRNLLISTDNTLICHYFTFPFLKLFSSVMVDL